MDNTATNPQSITISPYQSSSHSIRPSSYYETPSSSSSSKRYASLHRLKNTAVIRRTSSTNSRSRSRNWQQSPNKLVSTNSLSHNRLLNAPRPALEINKENILFVKNHHYYHDFSSKLQANSQNDPFIYPSNESQMHHSPTQQTQQQVEEQQQQLQQDHNLSEQLLLLPASNETNFATSTPFIKPLFKHNQHEKKILNSAFIGAPRLALSVSINNYNNNNNNDNSIECTPNLSYSPVNTSLVNTSFSVKSGYGDDDYLHEVGEEEKGKKKKDGDDGSSTTQTTENDQSIQPRKLSYTFTQPAKHSNCNQTNNNHSLIVFRCRICLEEEGDEPDGLMSPCRCKGTVGLVHRRCLQKWLLTSGKPSCELCGYAYIMTPSKRRRSSQFSTTLAHLRRFNPEFRNLRNWLDWQQTRKHLIADAISLILLLPACYVGVYFCIVGVIDYKAINPYGWQVLGLCGLAILIVLLMTIWSCLAVRHHVGNYRNYQAYQQQLALAEAARLSALPRYRFSVQPRPRGSSVVIYTLNKDHQQHSSPMSIREGQRSNESSIGHLDLSQSYTTNSAANNSSSNEQSGNQTFLVSVALTTVPEVAEDCTSSQSKTAFTSIV
ncbi:unnamed protein product [Trichobilharzia szidati]|nr:unnamed protein product [Trichobilharzia szidati]